METRTYLRIGLLGTASLAALLALWGSWYTIDQGERGVILRNGAVVGTAEPGLGFKVPFIDSVRRISVQSRVREYEAVAAYSKDQQTAVMRLSVSYTLPAGQVEAIYSEFGGEDGIVARLLDRQVSKSLEEVFGRFNAVTAVQDRARLGIEVQKAIQSAVVGPIQISGVQIENIDFSDAYERSIEDRMLAEVEVQKVQQNAEKEKVQAEIAVIQGQAKADVLVATAEANAKATRLAGEAEADAIRARAKALADNPALIALVQAEKWNGQLPTTMIPGASIPFLGVK
jgi:regulator of protease activity HflC (stomatin/prohibitin superfamily)